MSWYHITSYAEEISRIYSTFPSMLLSLALRLLLLDLSILYTMALMKICWCYCGTIQAAIHILSILLSTHAHTHTDAVLISLPVYLSYLSTYLSISTLGLVKSGLLLFGLLQASSSSSSSVRSHNPPGWIGMQLPQRRMVMMMMVPGGLWCRLR